MSLKGHITAVKSIQAALVASPIALHFANPAQPALNPPLGVLGDMVIPIALIAVGLAGILPWLLKAKRSAIRSAWASGLLCFICLAAFALCIQKFVVREDIPSRGTYVYILKGSDRTDFAKRNLADKTDAQMLDMRGHEEEDIHFLWTDGSIMEARLMTLVTYIGTWALLNFSIGSVAAVSTLKR